MPDRTSTITARLDVASIRQQITEIEETSIEFGNISINTFNINAAGMDTDALASQIQSSLNRHEFTLDGDRINADSIVKSATQKLAGSLTDSMKKTFSNIKDGITDFIGAPMDILKKAVGTVMELNTAMTELQKTTQASASQLNNFYFDANEMAKEYGTSTQDIINSTAGWSKLGYSLDDSKLMAQNSSIFKNISTDVNIDIATAGLDKIMKTYGISEGNALDGIISKINEVGSTAKTSNGEIVTGLMASSEAMAGLGASFEENVALFTAGQETIQDASKVGNALRNVGMRMTGRDENTGQLSEDLANINQEVANLTKSAGNGYQGISLFSDDGEIKYQSTMEYLGEISELYDDLSAKEQQDLLYKLFGNEQDAGKAILQNFDAAEKAMDTMANSKGSAERGMEDASQSLSFKTNALKESSVGIFQNLFQGEDIGIVIDMLTGLLNIVDALTEKLGLFATAGIGAGIAAFVKNFD